MRILITWRRTLGLRISSLAADCSWESVAVPPSKSSMVGAILATTRLKARTMQVWAEDMPKNFLSCYAERASLSLTHVQCLPILRDSYALSHTLRHCAIEFGGGLLRTRQQHGPRS